MDVDNILSGGIDVLDTMKESLLELEGYQKRSEELVIDEDKLERSIAIKEKAMADETLLTCKKRQEEIEFSFDEQIDRLRIRQKKIKTKRDKFKNAKISERIELETSDLAEEKRKLTTDAKSKFKINQISRIYNNRLFFAMFMPNSIFDFLLFLLALIVVLLLPILIYYTLPITMHTTFWLVILYLLILALFVCLYLLINRKVKEAHITVLKEVRAIRGRMLANKKAMKVRKKAISHDQDESSYGLEHFDEEIKSIEEAITQVAAEKQEALTTFESRTKQDLMKEIKSRYEEDLLKMKANQSNAHNDHIIAEEKIKQFKLEISRKYEAYVGKEFMSISMIDKLIETITSGDAATIAEAIAFQNRLIEQQIIPPAEQNK